MAKGVCSACLLYTSLKPFDCYTEAEREEIVFWKRVLADWEKYRQRGGMNAAEPVSYTHLDVYKRQRIFL